MGKPSGKKGPKFFGTFRRADVVTAKNYFTGRITPPSPLCGGATDGDITTTIPLGAIGLVHGVAAGAPEFLDVEFDVSGDGGIYRRVEVPPECVVAYQ